MIKLSKEKSFRRGIEDALSKAKELQNSILFSYSFRFDIRDLLPILTHPSDKNTIRIYWEQPSKGFSYAGLGCILEFYNSKNIELRLQNKQIAKIMKENISVSSHSSIGPRIVGGHAFNKYIGKENPQKYLVLQ